MNFLKTKKEHPKTQKISESEGKADIQKLLVDKNKDVYTKGGAKALDTKGFKVLYMWTHGKAPKVGQNKLQLLAVWNAANNNPIKENKPRKTEDQRELEILDANIIHICNTEIGRQTKKVVDHTLAVLPKMSKYQLRILINAIPSSL